MLSWAAERLEQLAQTVAPPPTDAVGRFLYAVQRNDESSAQGCLAEMMDPVYTVIQPTKGTYPIHLACQHGMEQLMRQLFAMPGATTDQVDSGGNTPLHYAALNSNPKTALHIVKVLVTEYRASVVAKNWTGQTPYDGATANAVRQYLLPLQLQQETQHALDNGGVGLPPGIDMGGLQIKNSHIPPPPIGGMPAMAPPPMMGAGIPATPPPGGPPNGQFATPSPGVPTTTTAAATPTQPPTSGGPQTYARTGHSSAAMSAASKYRPDGFHSSSSDVNLAKKYGNVNSGNAVSAVPPPPSSGNAALPVGPSSGGAGPNPYAAASTGNTINPYARGGIPKSRYLAYDGTALPTPPTSGTFNYYANPMMAPMNTTTTATAGGFTMFNPVGGTPGSAYAQPTPQGYQQPATAAIQGHDQQPAVAAQGYQQPDQGYQQLDQGYQQQSVSYQQPFPAQPAAFSPHAQVAQPGPSPYQQSYSAVASSFLPPPPISSASQGDQRPYAAAEQQPPAFASPYMQQQSPAGLSATPYKENPASVFAAPPSGGVPALPTQQALTHPVSSADYTTPVKVDPAAVFSAPPSGGLPVMPAQEPMIHTASTESAPSAHDLFSSGPSATTVEVSVHETPVAPSLEENEPVEYHQNEQPSENAAALFDNQPAAATDVVDAPVESSFVSPELPPPAPAPAAVHDIYDDSVADLQDVSLAETPDKHQTTHQTAPPPAAKTATDFFGLPPPPRML